MPSCYSDANYKLAYAQLVAVYMHLIGMLVQHTIHDFEHNSLVVFRCRCAKGVEQGFP